jgi:hypothetical protein
MIEDVRCIRYITIFFKLNKYPTENEKILCWQDGNFKIQLEYYYTVWKASIVDKKLNEKINNENINIITRSVNKNNNLIEITLSIYNDTKILDNMINNLRMSCELSK